MNLPADKARCWGALPAPMGDIPCSRRNTCARYVHRYEVGEATPMVQWLCPGKDDFWQFHIPVQERQDVQP